MATESSDRRGWERQTKGKYTEHHHQLAEYSTWISTPNSFSPQMQLDFEQVEKVVDNCSILETLGYYVSYTTRPYLRLEISEQDPRIQTVVFFSNL